MSKNDKIVLLANSLWFSIPIIIVGALIINDYVNSYDKTSSPHQDIASFFNYGLSSDSNEFVLGLCGLIIPVVVFLLYLIIWVPVIKYCKISNNICEILVLVINIIAAIIIASMLTAYGVENSDNKEQTYGVGIFGIWAALFVIILLGFLFSIPEVRRY